MKKNNSLLLSTPYILWMLIFTLIPLGVVGYYALTDPQTGAFTWGNIRDLGLFLPTLGISVWYSLISALICLLLGYPVAYYIAHRGETAQKILYMLVMLPAVRYGVPAFVENGFALMCTFGYIVWVDVVIIICAEREA